MSADSAYISLLRDQANMMERTRGIEEQDALLTAQLEEARQTATNWQSRYASARKKAFREAMSMFWKHATSSTAPDGWNAIQDFHDSL